MTNECGEVRHASSDGVSTCTFSNASSGVEKVEDKLQGRVDEFSGSERCVIEELTSVSLRRLTLATSLEAVLREATSEASSARTAVTAATARVKRRANVDIVNRITSS